MSVRRNSSRTNVNSAYNTAAVQTSNSKTIAPDTAVVRESSGGAFAPTITAVAITNSDYNIIDDTNVSTGGGYIRITGTGFVSGCVVYIGGVAALSTTLLNSTQVNVQINATSSNTLHVYLVNPDGSAAIYLSGITFSGVPSWVTDPTIPGVVNEVAFSIGLSATSNSTVAYSLTSGSALPPGTTLTSAGVFSGTVTGLSADTTYSFSVTATDLELQDTPRTFTVTVVIGDPYLYLTPVLLNGESNVWTRDSSVNKLLPIIGGDTRPTAFTPYNAYWSTLFAAGNYLTVSGNSNLAFGTNDFTIECFFYSTDVTTSGFIYDSRTADPQAVPVIYMGGGVVLYYVSGSNRITSGTIVTNRWYHLVVSRVSGSTRMFLNGTQTGSTYVDSTNYANGANRPVIGTNGDGASFAFYGYISNLRVLNGTGTTSPTVPTATLTAIANTQLLTLQDNRFKDNSTNAYTLTVTGATAAKSFSPFVETDLITGSAYFDGTGDFLTIADNAALELGAGNFCIELWIHPTSVSVTGTIIDKRSGTYGPLLFWRFGSTLQLYMSSNNSSWDLANGVTVGTVTANQWYHIAIYRVGSTIYSAFNGTVSTVTASGSATPHNNAGAWYFGTGTNGSSDPYTGYIADMRFVIGSGVYTGSNFTPPATSLTAITNTQLLTLQYRLGDNNHRFVEESGVRALTTRAGNASQGSFSPFSADDGYWSVSYPANAQRTYATMSTSIIDVKATATFTVEGWVMLTASASGAIMLASTDFSSAVTWYIGVDSTTSKPVIYWYTGSVVTCLGSTVLNVNQWYFLQFRANNGALTIGVNGVAETLTGTTTMGAPGNSTYLSFGSERSFNHPCYLYDVRISNSVRSFALPSTILSTDANTTFLGLRKRRIYDESSLATTLINAGISQPFSPFGRGTRATYSPATHGGSAYFDGSGDYVYVPNNAVMTLGTANHCIEFWMYPNGAQNQYTTVWYYSIGSASGATNTYYFSIGSDAGGGVILLGGPLSGTWAVTISLSSAEYTAVLNNWTHVVITRTGSAYRLFLNGILKGYTTYAGSIIAQGGSFSIGWDGANATTYYKGWISNFRVINGSIPTAYQTASTTTGTTIFTPPTSVPAFEANTAMAMNFTNAGIYNATGRNNFETIGANVTISNVASKWGGSSISFPGALTSYLVTPTNPLLDFATGDFTVECWVYFNSVAADQGLFGGSSTNAWEIRWRTSAGLTLGRLNTAFDSTFAWSPSAATWYHVAVTRSGTSVRGFVNGTQIGTTSTNSNTYNSGTLFYVGITDTSNNAFNGYLDDVRITKGYARYTANFTAPTSSLLTK